MKSSAPLPSLKLVDRALRATTERLAHECASPLSAPPQWDDLHWCVAQAAAAMHGVSPLLRRTLRWGGPRAWQDFLEDQRQQTLYRHRRIVELVSQLHLRAQAARIAAVALKGVALHELGVYAPGTRPMADVDLLVAARDAAAGSVLLGAMGYEERYSTWRERTFEPSRAVAAALGLGEHAENAIKIELHTRVAERLPVREAVITELLLPPPTAFGVNPYGSLAALMTHLLLHAAGNMRSRSLRLIQLNDIAALAARLDSRDWQWVLERERSVRGGWSFPPLALTACYYPGAIPAAVLHGAYTACSGLLRSVSIRQRLSDVSLSRLWMQLCPGIEWCGSVAEALNYVRARAFPSREARAAVQMCDSTQLWAVHSPWTRLSRTRRIARWMVRRPPRAATMWPVHAAWEQVGMRAPRGPAVPERRT
ncbi:MAG TPA: nucleotidyltransferase family protein [Steroidobacteraceae bacterium]